MADIDITDDVDDVIPGSGDVDVDDESTPDAPIDSDVDDDADREDDDYDEDERGTIGPEGDPIPSDSTPTPTVIPEPTVLTRTVRTEEYITDYSAASLAAYEASGAMAYAVHDDGTETQVLWSQVSDPSPIGETASNEAAAVAAAINQHFWSRATDPDQDGAGTGAFVTDDERDDFLEAAADGFPDWGDGTQGTKPWHNLLMNSLGILLRTALNNLVSITRSAIAFFDGTGNQAANVVASFGSGGAQIGKTGESHIIIGSNSIKMSESTSNLFTIEFDGLVNIINSGGDTSAKPYSNNDINNIAAMLNTGYTVNDSTVFDPEGNRTLYTITRNAVKNRFGKLICSPNLYIYYDDTSGIFEPSTLMSPQVDHDSIPTLIAMGETSVKATGENLEIYASGIASGDNSIASGQYSHAQNIGTIAASRAQTALGRFNIGDTNGTYALMVGNGTDDSNRSNALTVDWDGKVKMGQILTIHSLPSSSAQIDTSTNNGAASSAVVFGRTEIMDKNGTWVSTYGSNTQTNGQTRSYIGCNNMKTDGTTATNYLNIGVNKDGSAFYGVTDPAAFRKAIGGIGTRKNVAPDPVSCPNTTWTEVTSVSLEAGMWLVLYGGAFAANATGHRDLFIGTSAPGAGRVSPTAVAVTGGEQTRMSSAITYNPGSTTTYKLYARQNSGGALNFWPYIQAVKRG